MSFFAFLLTMLFALAGGWAAERYRLPSGALLGAIFGVAIANMLLLPTCYYGSMRVALQILIGIMVGGRIGRAEIREMKILPIPILILTTGMLLMNLLFGGLIYRFSSLDIATALFATTPGGITDMALLSAEMGANTAYVSVLHMARVMIVFTLILPAFRGYLAKHPNVWHKEEAAALTTPGEEPDRQQTFRLRQFLSHVAVALAGGLLLRRLGVPAGAMVGSMLACAALCIHTDKVHLPSKFRFLMKIFSGAYIGIGIDRAAVATLSELLIPLFVMTVGIFGASLLIAALMRRLTGLDLAVCLLSSTPGGIQEIALLSDDLGADTPKIATLHTVRLVFVILVFPSLIRWISYVWG